MLLECTAWVRCFLSYEMVTKVGAINRVVVVVVVYYVFVFVFVAAAGGARVGAGCCGFIVNTINTICTFCYWQLRWCETTLKAFRLR